MVFFLLKEHQALVVKSEDFPKHQKEVKYATQSGPMLVLNNQIHSAFNEGSTNVHIRSGVGVTKTGEVVFAISKKRVNFYDFALLFKEKYNCPNALYLDGFVSKMYLPAINRLDDGGNFGAMIAVSTNK